MAIESMLQNTLNKGFKRFKKQYVALILGTLVAAIGSRFIITLPPLFFGVIDGIGGALRIGWLVSHPYVVLCTCIAAEKLSKEK